MWIEPKVNWTDTETVNVNDWNRIERNTEHVAQIVSVHVNTKTWYLDSLPKVSEINRIKSNINIMAREKIDIIHDNLQKFGYQDLNQIERALKTIYENAKEIELSITKCGTISCGQNIGLPL